MVVCVLFAQFIMVLCSSSEPSWCKMDGFVKKGPMEQTQLQNKIKNKTKKKNDLVN